MIWTTQRKVEAATHATCSRAFFRDDTRVVERPGWYQVVTPSAPGTMINEIVLSDVAPEDAESVIDEAIATYRATGHPVKWCVGPWTKPDDFGDRLARRGFESWGVRGMGQGTADSLPAPEDVTIVEIDASTVDAYVTTELHGWSMPEEQRELERRAQLAAMSERPRIAWAFAAQYEGAWVGTSALALRGDYAYLLGTQVLEAARGRGVYRALVAARLAFLRARGIAYAVTHARDATSAPILERFGFETLFHYRCFVLAT